MRTGNDLTAPLAGKRPKHFWWLPVSLSLSVRRSRGEFPWWRVRRGFHVACLAIFTCVFTLLTTGLQSHYCDASTMCGRRLHKFQRQASEREIFHIYSRIPSGRETKKMDSRHTSREP